MTTSSAAWPQMIEDGIDAVLSGEAECFLLGGLRARQDRFAAFECARDLATKRNANLRVVLNDSGVRIDVRRAEAA